MNPFQILAIIIEKYTKILSSKLVGIYLHGSLAMGCYTDSSDIDFLVVVKEPLDRLTKKQLISVLLALDNLPKKGIEMSIILEKYTHEFLYPTPFELHYSDSLKDKYVSDGNYICGGTSDYDLAAHMMVIKRRGICLYGKKIESVFKEVPRKAYIDSIIYDIENAVQDILKDPVYIILNLCRVLYFLKENIICSKLEGGNWGKESLPAVYLQLIDDAVNVYLDKLETIQYSGEHLINFANYMLNQINMHKLVAVNIEEVKRMTSANYAKHAEIWGLFSGNRKEEEEFWAYIAKPYGNSILAAMSATGDMAAALARRDFNVTALDIEKEMIKEGKRRYGDITALNFIQADLRSLDIPDRQYDFAFIGTSSFHHFLTPAERRDVFRNIANNLRSGGALALELWYPASRSWSSPWRIFEPLSQASDPDIKIWKKGKSDFDAEKCLITITQEIFMQRGEEIEQFAHSFQMQLFDRKALREMLEEAGYILRKEYGSYKMETWTPESPTWIVEAVKVNSFS